MTKEKRLLIHIALIIFATICFFLILYIRLSLHYPPVEYSTICNYKYGENWSFEYTKPFGSTCIELDFVNLNIKQRVIISRQELQDTLNEMCSPPSFWNFMVWKDKCMEYTK